MTLINKNSFPTIRITHVPTGKTVEFDAYIERFSDNFNSQWESTEVFGRMDDIRNFKRTTRTIDLGWTVISEDNNSAANNYANCSSLMAMLYPVYTDTDGKMDKQKPIDIDYRDEQSQISSRIEEINNASGGSAEELLADLNDQIGSILESTRDRQQTVLNQARTSSRSTSIMSSPPIFKINFANLIKNGSENDNQLYGTIEGFKYEPDVEMGFFIDGIGDEQMMYPKVVSLSFAFTVIHTSKLGWEFDGKEYKLRNDNFPFHKKR
jgi:ElaB/YqjD/DUF883 family membrane-anchored ribosome-binding protein